MIVEVQAQKSAEWSCQLETQGRVVVRVQRNSVAEFRLPWRKPVFDLLRHSTDWMRSTHIMVINLLPSKSTDLNINIIY